MTAEEYLMGHWIRKKIYTHNENPKHKDRFDFCASNIIGEKFIDVGCACGHSTNTLATLHPGSWSGIDFAEVAIDMAKKEFPQYTFYYSPDYNYVEMVGRYDSVVCSEVLEHVPDDISFVKTLLQIADKRIVLTTPNRPVNDPGHVRVHTEQSLKELFKGYNIEIISKGIFYFIIVYVNN